MPMPYQLLRLLRLISLAHRPPTSIFTCLAKGKIYLPRANGPGFFLLQRVWILNYFSLKKGMINVHSGLEYLGIFCVKWVCFRRVRSKMEY